MKFDAGPQLEFQRVGVLGREGFREVRHHFHLAVEFDQRVEHRPDHVGLGDERMLSGIERVDDVIARNPRAERAGGGRGRPCEPGQCDARRPGDARAQDDPAMNTASVFARHRSTPCLSLFGRMRMPARHYDGWPGRAVRRA